MQAIINEWRLQPIISAENESILGFEILAQLPADVQSEEFFNNVGDKTFIHIICGQLNWIKDHSSDQYKYFCNLPVKVFCNPHWCETLLQLITQQDIKHNLVIELQDPQNLAKCSADEIHHVVENIDVFRRCAVPVWLDDITPKLIDFITPFAKYFDGIKVDKYAFWELIGKTDKLKLFISKCHKLCSSVLIEGIETIAHQHQASGAGADFLQGFLWHETRQNVLPPTQVLISFS